MSTDLPTSDVASCHGVINLEESYGWLGRHSRQSAQPSGRKAAEKQAKLDFMTAVGDRRQLSMTAHHRHRGR